MEKFGVWCEVWGGMSGSRESWLKENGKRSEYATASEAAEVAHKLTRGVAENPFRTANFRYTAKAIRETEL